MTVLAKTGWEFHRFLEQPNCGCWINSARITETIRLTSGPFFHYTYSLLHHPEYRAGVSTPSLYAGLLGFTQAGQRLADIHVGYEDQLEYPLESY